MSDSGPTISDPALGRFVTWSSTPETVADVQGWLDAPASNFGWVVRIPDESVGATARRFSSREDLVEERRPVLLVEYTPIPEPSGVARVLTQAAAAAGLGLRRVARSANGARG